MGDLAVRGAVLTSTMDDPHTAQMRSGAPSRTLSKAIFSAGSLRLRRPILPITRPNRATLILWPSWNAELAATKDGAVWTAPTCGRASTDFSKPWLPGRALCGASCANPPLLTNIKCRSTQLHTEHVRERHSKSGAGLLPHWRTSIKIISPSQSTQRMARIPMGLSSHRAVSTLSEHRCSLRVALCDLRILVRDEVNCVARYTSSACEKSNAQHYESRVNDRKL
jgi:hypothetical protein